MPPIAVTPSTPDRHYVLEKGIVRNGCSMTVPRDFIEGPWRAVPMLGVTHAVLGTIFYTPVLIVPLIVAERGWSSPSPWADFQSAPDRRIGRSLRRPFDRPFWRARRHDHRFADRSDSACF